MKYLKFILGIIGAICAIPLLLTFLVVFSAVVSFIFKLALFQSLFSLASWIVGCILAGIVIVVGYLETVGFLERHFKIFKENTKDDTNNQA